MNQFKCLILIVLLMSFLVIAVFCQKEKGVFQYKKWIVSKSILSAGLRGTFDDIAVKDPSLVYYNEKYHLFYTSKTAKETTGGLKYITGIGYVSSSTLEGLNSAKRYNINAIVEDIVIDPQIFYFEPHQLWYLVAQTPVSGRPNLAPIYLTNPDIDDPYGWSKPKIIETKSTNGYFWIDFWVICDEKKAHMFYTDHRGSFFRFECPIDEFPYGFANKREETVLTVWDYNEKGRWILYETSQVYYVKKTEKYLNLAECGYPRYEPYKKYERDARNRFSIVLIADSLEGHWKRVEASESEFACDPAYLFNEDGSPSKYDQVSHPELIRSGYNQRMEVDDYNLQILFQAFDASNTPDSYYYHDLPWELVTMKNY